MMPSPPIWISRPITTLPNTDQCADRSTTARPVTHTDEVAVNRAVSQPADSPDSVANGRARAAVPSSTATPKAVTII